MSEASQRGSSAATAPQASTAGTAAPGREVTTPGKRGFRGLDILGVLMFVGPAMFLVTVFVIYPTIRTILLSFYEQFGRGANAPTEFVGLQNYVTLLRDQFIRDAILNNVLWIVIVTPLTTILGVVFAVLFDRVRYERVAKAIIFVPMAISAVATAVIWRLMYAPDPEVGTLNAIITSIGLEPQSWLGRTDLVNYALMIAYLWMSLGFAVVVLSAALKSIPGELMEAARIDGAGELQIFRNITVPLMWPTITVIITLTVIGLLKIFDLIYVMTAGGPAGASDVIATRMYQAAFAFSQPGYGAAIATVLLLAIIPVMAINIRRFRSEEAGR